MSAAPKHEHYSISGIGIHCLTAGSGGSPLVLLHGGGLDSASLSWGPSMERLSDHHRVWAPDWPGFGESSKPVVNYTTEYFIDTLHRLLEHLGVARVSLAGLSMGGAAAIGFALRWPARVDRLVLVDSYGLGRRAPWAVLSYLMIRLPLMNEAAWWLESRSPAMLKLSLGTVSNSRLESQPALVDEVLGMMRRPAAGRAFRSWQRSELVWSGLRTDYRDRLAELKPPVLILHGRQDKLVPVSWAESAAKIIPGARLRVVDDCGHWFPRDAQDVFIEETLRFLSPPR